MSWPKGQLDLGWHKLSEPRKPNQERWGVKKKEVTKCQLQEQTCLPTRVATELQTSLRMTDPHQGLETGLWACLKSCHGGLGLFLQCWH